MQPTVVRLSLAFAAFSGGCLGPGNDLSHAAATNACGPADGPATVIVLANQPVLSPTAPPDPFVRLTIQEAVSTLGGRSWIIGPQSNAFATYSSGRTVAQQATSGRVTISGVDHTQQIEGIVELNFPTRRVVTGFRAPWSESLILCG